MAKITKQSDNFNYIVESAPSFMQLPDNSFVKDGFLVNRRADNFAVLGKVTDRYGIVQNADLVTAAEDAFKQSGLTDYTRKIVVTGDGERMHAIYDFRNRTQKLVVGDEVGLRLTVQNSFDGSLRASFLAGMLRLVCSNGMVRMTDEVGMTQKHGASISVSFISTALDMAIAKWKDSAAVLNRLASVAITQEQGTAILSRLVDSGVMSARIQKDVAPIWASPTHAEDSARNLYNLYNAVTQHLTHGVSGERFELANRVSSGVLAAFERASVDSNRLARLVAPLPQVEAVALN